MATWTASVANRWVQLRVTAVETGVSTANNTSKVRVSTEIYYPGGSSTFDSWAQTLTVSVNGTQIGQQTGITYSLSTSNRTRTLNTYTSDAITHNSDGSKTVNIRVNYAGQPGVVNTTISQSLRLTTIPRATTLSAFSFGSSLRDGYSNTIKYTVDKKSSSFRNQIQLRDGSTTVFTWDNQNTDGSNSITLKASEVNTLLNRMSTTTSKSFTLRVATRSGHNGGWVGSAVSMNATATVNSNVAPTASGMSTEIHGSGHDNSIGKYVQGITRVTASFDGGAGYGASITSRNITIRRVSGGSDTQTIGAASGTTPRAVNLSGTYEALGTITDSRGRTSPTARTTFTVEAYSSPTINNFTANRNEDAQTLVNISISGRHSHLDGGNRLSYTIQRRQGTGSWVNVSSGATGSSVSATFSRTASSSGNSVTSSYEFRIVAEDQLGGRVELVRSVSTQQVVMDIYQDIGVGIGKMYEPAIGGALQVGDDAYFEGDITSRGVLLSALTDMNEYLNARGITATDTFEFWSGLPQGKYIVNDWIIPNQPSRYGILETSSPSVNMIWYSQASGSISRKSGNQNGMTDWILIDRPERGSNDNGDWIRFNDGTQMCWSIETATYKASSHLELYWSYPKNFINDSISGSAMRDTYWGAENYTRAHNTVWHGSATAHVRIWTGTNTNFTSSDTARVSLFAIGRWK